MEYKNVYDYEHFTADPRWDLGINTGFTCAAAVFQDGNWEVALEIMRRVRGRIILAEIKQTRSSNYVEAEKLERYREWAEIIYDFIFFRVNPI